ncbi:ACP S-malonyltransferase [Flavobacteriaceae bacterium Ap0902]|nr:ACP S-malonyltransferase [Flavobacteriaceae bacterium Ap0902]
MKAYVFPGQGAQFTGMGKDLYDKSNVIKGLFEQANQILGFDIRKIMFEGTKEELKQTNVTQPAIFLHSVAAVQSIESFEASAVAGHSLGEFSALVAANVLSFADGMRLVSERAEAMQEAILIQPSTMAAILGLEDKVVEDICQNTEGIVVPANYNCPGQLVISGEIEAVEKACEKAKEAGAKRALILPVGGAFHSPLMAPARDRLKNAIEEVSFNIPICPIYQNVTTTAVIEPEEIKSNLIAQLTSPVKWTQSIQNMWNDGITSYLEIGPGKTLQGLIRKIERKAEIGGIS